MSDSRTAQTLGSTFGVEGRRVLVTGAGSGIGKATAKLFAAAGARVAAAGRREATVSATADAIRADGGEALALEVDIADEAAVRRAFAQVAERWGGLDVLVNNAAFRPKADFMSMTVEQWDHMHAVNTRGTFLCLREAVRLMRAAGKGGAIVNVSSVSSVHPVVFANTHYDSSKAGINALTRTAALEFARDGIRINAVLAGGTDTEGARALRESGAIVDGPITQGPQRHPLGRRAAPQEIAAAILYLAGPGASFITGHLLLVDGGFVLS